MATIPDWVPDSVKSIATAMSVRGEIHSPFWGVDSPLLRNPRMKNVWGQLGRQAGMLEKRREDGKLESHEIPLEIRLAALPSGRTMENWGIPISGVSLPDQACAAFFCSVATELAIPKGGFTQAEFLEKITPLRSAANVCRMAIDFPRSPRTDAEIAKCLRVVSDYLEEEAQYILDINKEKANVLPRSSGQRNDDTRRATVRALALIVRATFGKLLYGTLATLASVALDQDLNAKTVRNWCKGLPPE